MTNELSQLTEKAIQAEWGLICLNSLADPVLIHCIISVLVQLNGKQAECFFPFQFKTMCVF